MSEASLCSHCGSANTVNYWNDVPLDSLPAKVMHGWYPHALRCLDCSKATLGPPPERVDLKNLKVAK